jgi:hypothetical protein
MDSFDNGSVVSYGVDGGGGNFLTKLLKNKRFWIFVVILGFAIFLYFCVFKGNKEDKKKKGNTPTKAVNEEDRDVEQFLQQHPQQQQQQHPQQPYNPPPPPPPPKVRESIDSEGTTDGGFTGFGDVRGNSNNSFIRNLESKFQNNNGKRGP